MDLPARDQGLHRHGGPPRAPSGNAGRGELRAGAARPARGLCGAMHQRCAARPIVALAGASGPRRNVAGRAPRTDQCLFPQQPQDHAGALPALPAAARALRPCSRGGRQRIVVLLSRLLRGPGHLVSPRVVRRKRAPPAPGYRATVVKGFGIRPCRPAGAAGTDRPDRRRTDSALPRARGGRAHRTLCNALCAPSCPAADRPRLCTPGHARRTAAPGENLPRRQDARRRPGGKRPRHPRRAFRAAAGRHVAGGRGRIRCVRRHAGRRRLPVGGDQ